jgi:hypothetical protein
MFSEAQIQEQAAIQRRTIAAPPRKAVPRRPARASNYRLDPYDMRSMQMPLPYAQPLPWYRGPRARAMVVRMVIVGAILCGVLWAFRLAQQIDFLFVQRHLMRYTMPADRIVLAAGTPDAQQLLGTPGYHRLAGGILDTSGLLHVAAHNPPKDVPLFWSPNETYVFLHARRSPGRHERLLSVVVGLQRPFEPGLGYDLTALAQAPGNLILGSRPTPCSQFGSSGGANIRFTNSLRIFAGQPDPNDESHFTIRYELDGKSNVIDGWLMSDDSVKLQPR